MTHQEDFELFWRNPFNYWKQLQEVGECNVTWDRGMVAKVNADPFLFSEYKFGKINPNWTSYVIGIRDTQEFNATCDRDRPAGSYLTFDWDKMSLHDLEAYLKNPWGKDPSRYNDSSIELKERPVKGQDTKVFITNLPPMQSTAGYHAMEKLEAINKNWDPYAKFFIHRSYSFNFLFGRGWWGADFDPRTDAAGGRVFLIHGKKVDPRNFPKEILEPHFKLFGFTYDDMSVAANRCKYNILSVKYASHNFAGTGRPHKRKSGSSSPMLDVLAPSSQIKFPSPKDLPLVKRG